MRIRAFVLVSYVFLAASAFSATTSVNFASPRGGEVYVAGQNQFVRLDDRTKLKTVTLEISRDGGATFLPLGTIDNTVKVGRNVLQFGVTGPTSTNCVIRAKGIQGKTEVTGLSGAFSIVSGNSLGPIATPEIADGAVTTPKLADRAATEAKIGSGAASANMFLKSDGLGGAIFAALSGDGSGITNIGEAALPANVTLQGNTFNAANSLLKLEADGTVPLALGGTGASLTANNGGILYSTASSMEILPGVANAGRVLQSGAAGAPSWSTAAYPGLAGPIGNVLQSNGTNFVSAPFSSANLPSVPSARAYHSTNQPIPSGTDVMLLFNSERFDNDNMHDTSTNTSRLTCRTPGKYLIVAQIQWAPVANGYRQVHLIVNDNTFIGTAQDTAAGTSYARQFASTVYHLNAGDYVTVVVNQTSGSTMNVESLGNLSPEFMMVRLGE